MLPRTRLVSAALLAAAAAVVAPATATAFVPGRALHHAPPVAAAPAAAVKAPLRQGIDVTAVMPTRVGHAWQRFRDAEGAGWRATWDRATGVPSRIWGSHVDVPGANRSPDVALWAALRFLADHVDLLAPGASPTDFVPVSNHDDGHGLRSIGFAQYHQGVRVVGGQVSFRFKHDRLFVIASQALPRVRVPAIARGRAAAAVVDQARDATATELGLTGATARAAGDAVIVPLVTDDAVLGYRLAAPVDVDAGAAGAWTVYADPTSGAPLVRVDRRHWATGTVLFDAPERYPGGGRVDYPARLVNVTVDGGPATTSADGTVAWGRDQSVPLVTTVGGERVQIINVDSAGGDDPPEATANLTIAPDGTARWSEAGTDILDAQLATYVHAQIAKDFARTILTDPQALAYVDDILPATVNINDDCNAYYTRNSDQQGTVNFFAASPQCENTGRLADVVYHEFGHGVHDFSVIDGVGSFDGAMSEGAADFLSAIITEDHGMGRGFFYDDRPLRDIDEADRERIWPDDVGEIHDTGIIYSGALWDMRKAAIDLLGDVEGRAFAARIYVGTLQRATDIPSSLLEALVTDDDDGDLGNGTPNECLIREAFGRHGLRTVSASIENVGALAATAGETTTPVTVTLGGLSVACTGDEVDHVTLSWLPRSDADSPATGSTLMSPGPGDTFTGDLPLPDPGQVGLYRVEVSFFDGTSTLFPDNRGDPYYEVYRGETVELYCDDFEADPFAPGPDAWTHGAEAGDDPWQWGPPLGLATDPDAAYSGDNVVGMWLDSDDGQYQPSSVSWLQSPVIDVGDYSDVRLHYRRWLGVEDGFYDKATIYANGEVAWQNYDSGQSLDASRHTLDADWVFKDVALSTRIYDGTVQLMFELTSDEGLEFGGWTLDDVCVVANPNSVCGDGVITGSEQCDDGDDNADAPDACRVNCRRARCGDGIVDQLEQCDDGGRADGDGCSRICELEGEPDGCCSSSDQPSKAIAPLLLAAFGLLAMRRRRRPGPRA